MWCFNWRDEMRGILWEFDYLSRAWKLQLFKRLMAIITAVVISRTRSVFAMQPVTKIVSGDPGSAKSKVAAYKWLLRIKQDATHTSVLHHVDDGSWASSRLWERGKSEILNPRENPTIWLALITITCETLAIIFKNKSIMLLCIYLRRCEIKCSGRLKLPAQKPPLQTQSSENYWIR